MANIVFARTDDPNSKAIKDGQLVFDTSGNGKMYLDNGTERLEMGGSMSVDSVLNAESTNPIQNKAVAGVMLKTLDEVGAVTKAGFIPDALTVKQLNSNLTANEQRFKFSYQDGKYGYMAKVEGADTFFPFKSTPTFLGSCYLQDGGGGVWEAHSLSYLGNNSEYGSINYIPTDCYTQNNGNLTFKRKCSLFINLICIACDSDNSGTRQYKILKNNEQVFLSDSLSNSDQKTVPYSTQIDVEEGDILSFLIYRGSGYSHWAIVEIFEQ